MRLNAFILRKPALFPLRVLAHAWYHSLDHHIFTRASALTYTSFLAVVPTLILIHSIAGAFGILDLAQDVLPILNRQLQLGLPVHDLMPILSHAQSIGFGQLGIIGSASLFVTFVLAMENLETNLNVLWHVRDNRTYLRKILLSIPFLFLVGVLIGGVTGFMSYLQYWMQELSAKGITILQDGYWQWLSSWGLFVGSHFVLWLCLYLVYQLVPNTKVNYRYALVSALIAVINMRILIWCFLHLQTYFFQRMSLFYGSLAFIPLVMLLVYGLWCEVLFGNALCWRLQHWPPRKGARHLKDNL